MASPTASLNWPFTARHVSLLPRPTPGLKPKPQGPRPNPSPKGHAPTQAPYPILLGHALIN
ncbi:hypothetical protein HanRHA438_Chr08g0369271 [Helianthus annuus]|nr:hypothetical protein HanRHA438_Chr08g0369271 [Helianthus annuus]